MGESSDNLDQCLKEMDGEFAAADAAQVEVVRQGSLKTMGKMMFEDSPVRSGMFRASFDLGINDVSNFRRRWKKRQREAREKRLSVKAWQAELGTMKGEADKQYMKAKARLSVIKRLEDVKFVAIVNAAPHANLVEQGISKKAPGGVFAVGERQAEMIFGGLAGKA